MPLTANKIFKVNVSGDRLIATLAPNEVVPSKALSAEQIVAEVTGLGLVIDAEGGKQIEAIAANLAQGQTLKPVVIARGKPPRNEENGRIEKLYEKKVAPEKKDAAPAGANQAQNFYDRSNIITVKAGDAILRVIPPVKGADGVDVYGKAIPHKLGREATVKLGSNVRLEGDLVLAACGGKLEYVGDKVSVSPGLEIRGDVDFSVGNVHFGGEILIAKNVLDLFKVEGGSGIVINGVAEAAEVHAGSDLTIMGGVAGKGKGKFTAGHDIRCKYITNAHVRAGHDVIVRAEIVNCNLICNGCVTVENGPLVGGHTVATGGVKVKQLGSEAEIKTLVEAGIDETVREKCREIAPEIALRQRKAKKIREAVEPLWQNQRYLNAEQKEKTMKLINSADELEEGAKKLVEELRQLYQASQKNALAEVMVGGAVFGGVTIRFPFVEVVLINKLNGPLKIVPEKVQETYKIFAIDDRNGAKRDLEASISNDETWETLEKLLQVHTQQPAARCPR